MVNLVEAENVSLAWVKGCDYILKHGFLTKKKIKLNNLIVDIKTTALDEKLDKLIRAHLDMQVFQQTLSVVSSEKSFGSHPNYWRRLKGKEEFKTDQIAQVVSRLKSQPHSTKLTLCIYTSDDFNRQYVPCILCMELRVENHRLYLNAFVRSQDFAKKSYADYIGLSQILQRIAQDSNIQPAGILVHTITAFISHTDLNRVKTILRETSPQII